MGRARHLPPLNAVRTFEAAARNGSFLKAAEELNVTPGAVSRLVKTLENHLDVPLFLRSHRAVALSEDGQRYAESITQALDIIDRATDELRMGSNANVLSLRCHPTFAVHWLLPRWARFHAGHPGIQIDLKTTLVPESLNMDAVDFVIRIDRNSAPEERHGFVSERLVDVESLPVCAPQLLRRVPLNRPEDLRNHVLLHGALRPHDWPRWLEAAGISGVPSAQGPTFESLTLAYNAALAGAGVAIGIRAFVADDLSAGRLIKPFDFVRLSKSGFNMVYSAERFQRFRKVRAFRDWLLQERVREKEGGAGEAAD
ncbi:transcriptional regulator GcvA [Microbaculum marinisediminis]|uniref:Transcriptional regulator GcvA n=1 Tax=Microbaculum marinisediminis TaxID=2931392 RepID=A0AAW5QV87_9HYPH|nr:transcriptional regulator GcvA [Microbaculum sp. A6E488]MCT8971807.1 transcriptional regulator GcvA [Microbaculum sp. A6E488]